MTAARGEQPTEAQMTTKKKAKKPATEAVKASAIKKAAAPETPVEAPPAPKPRPSARFHRKNSTLAQQMGSSLVRYLRLHAKSPYGRRGENAIIAWAIRTAHQANVELDARQSQ